MEEAAVRKSQARLVMGQGRATFDVPALQPVDRKGPGQGKTG